MYFHPMSLGRKECIVCEAVFRDGGRYALAVTVPSLSPPIHSVWTRWTQPPLARHSASPTVPPAALAAPPLLLLCVPQRQAMSARSSASGSTTPAPGATAPAAPTAATAAAAAPNSAKKPAATAPRKTGARGRKGAAAEEPPAPVDVGPPPKTEEQLLEEQFASTLLSTPAPSSPQPLHSPADVKWTLSLPEILGFCFPPGVQHPRSRGRLWVLANQGPLVARHTYTACLCPTCQQAVRERRMEDPYVRRVFRGEAFTSRNVRASRKEEAEVAIAAAAGEAAAAAATQPVAIPALAAIPTTAAPVASSVASSSPAAVTASVSRTPSKRPAVVPSLHNARPHPVAPLHLLFSAHVVDQLPFLCNKCTAHARNPSSCHIFGGKLGALVLTSLQVNELARRLDEEDLLLAYNRLRKLGPEEEREFLAKLDGEKTMRAKLNYTPEQMEALLAPLPRLIDPVTGALTDRVDFYALQALVNADRNKRVERLAQMYPDAAVKGDKDDLQSQAVAMQHTVGERSLAKKRSALVASPMAVEAARTGKPNPKLEEAKDGGLTWPGESMLSYAMLQRRFPPHQSHALRTRLLHKHTHQVVELGPAVNSPSVQLSVALMRNQCLNDRTEGWNTHF